MTGPAQRRSGFTLIELLVVVAIIGLLAALILPALTLGKRKAGRASCTNQLKQINLAVLMYADEHEQTLPELPHPNPYTNGVYFFYKELVKSYVGLKGPASETETLFACPADTGRGQVPKMSAMALNDFSSYLFNGGNSLSNGYPGIAGKKLKTIGSVTRTILVAEHPAFIGYSWHEPKAEGIIIADGWFAYNNGKSVCSFVDGHVSFIPIYMNGIAESATYDPPSEYLYNWSGR